MKRLRLILLAVSALMVVVSFSSPVKSKTKFKPKSPIVKAAMAGGIVQPAPALPRKVPTPAVASQMDKHAHEPPPPPPPPPAPESEPVVASGSVWDRLAQCESGGRWNYNGGSGYDGGLQFHPSTWSAYAPTGYPAYAYQASREQQIAVAELVLAEQGWGAWPACSRKLGLR